MIFNNVRQQFTVLIPHYKNPARLKRLVARLSGYRVVVADDSVSGLGWLAGARVVRVGQGSGFARAVNRGLDEVDTDYVVVLNDDTWPVDDCLEQLFLTGGVCGPVLVGALGVESTGIRVRSWGRVVQQTKLPTGTVSVDALSGACLGMPSGLRFDEGFRHGSEDVALCRAFQKAGGVVQLVGSARCFHTGGGSLSRQSAAARRYAVMGHLRLFGPSWRDGVVVGLAIGQCVRENAGLEGVGAVMGGWWESRVSR